MKKKGRIGKFLVSAVIAITATYSHAQQKDFLQEKSDWKFQAGVGVRSLTPVVFVAGVNYKSLAIRAQGLGTYSGENDFWCGFRGSLLWTFFGNLPFNLDMGVGGGYEFAEAPNKIHQAINTANNGKFLLPYNYKENLDVSLEVWAHLYGFYTQVSVPVFQFKKHDVNYVQWGAGYMVEF